MMIIVVVILVIVIAVTGYLLMKPKTSPQTIGDINQTVSQGVLPSLDGNTNPLKNKPDVNPAEASNPFRSIKTNPFQ